jgi:tRNA1(Val) A37 N6-methylase TrmN6
MTALALPEHSVDAFLGGRVTLVQPLKGHRAGLDAALLQALVPADADGEAIDLGTGVGTVALALAARVAGLNVTGVERDRDALACGAAALARPENAAFVGRVRFLAADVAAGRVEREAAGLLDRSADWVLMNPPFDAEGRVRASPDPARRAAHVSGPEELAGWCRTAAGLLKPGGSLGLIHRASALPAILAALPGRFGEAVILPVHPSATAPATRVLVRARRGSRGPLSLAPGLVLHREDGGWTELADALLRGERALSA